MVAGAVAGPVIELDLRELYLRSISLIGSTMHTPEQFEVLVAAANAGEVTPVVARSFPLEAVRSAHEEYPVCSIEQLVIVPPETWVKCDVRVEELRLAEEKSRR